MKNPFVCSDKGSVHRSIMDLMPINEESFLPPKKGPQEGNTIPTEVINAQTLTQNIKQ